MRWVCSWSSSGGAGLGASSGPGSLRRRGGGGAGNRGERRISRRSASRFESNRDGVTSSASPRRLAVVVAASGAAIAATMMLGGGGGVRVSSVPADSTQTQRVGLGFPGSAAAAHAASGYSSASTQSTIPPIDPTEHQEAVADWHARWRDERIGFHVGMCSSSDPPLLFTFTYFNIILFSAPLQVFFTHICLYIYDNITSVFCAVFFCAYSC